jgi:two-component system sensor histidine kinase DesK
MLRRIRGLQQRHWRERSKAERVELHTVITWHGTIWFFAMCWLPLPLAGNLERRPLPLALGGLLLLVGALQCVAASRLTRPALDHYLGRRAVQSKALTGSVLLLALALALVMTLTALDGIDALTTRFAIGGTLVPFGLIYALVVPVRVCLRRAGVLAVLLMAAVGLIDADVSGVLTTAAMTAFAVVFSLLASRCGAWTLSVLWEAERAREVEARLAVAEERLRFGRDLHDVLGRNLAVIALKSELAVQLARRERPEAVEQMIEVQRIAQESQREVRDVVRGYRAADLAAELAGAQGVLTAAGIHCEVHDEAGGLPAEVQSALGWVVREATTNVLRHGDAARCTVGLRAREGCVVLTVENDGMTRDGGDGGAPVPGSGPGGSGLAGLRERLAVVDGTLEAGPAGGDRFRVVAEVPVQTSGTEWEKDQEVSGVTS